MSSSSPSPPPLLSRLGDAVRSINPTLVTDPPPPTEVTGRDVCYLGDAGGDDDVVYCEDLADGLRPMVGSWYLSAERHVVEYVVATMLWLLVLMLVIPRLAPHRPPPRYFIGTASDDSDNEDKVTGDESTGTGFSLRPPKPLRLITYVVCTLMVSYKALGYPGKLYFLLMPCNVNWLVALLLCLADVDDGSDDAVRDDRRKTTSGGRPWSSLGRNGGNALLQCGIGWSGLALVALVTPDTSDLTLPCEVPYFFTSHAVLMAFPFVFLLTNQISTLPHPDEFGGGGGGGSKARGGWEAFAAVASHFAKWFVVTLATFSLFYVAVVTPLSIWTGLNLNYMLSPPPNPGDLVGGANYRIVSCCCVASVFFVMRFLTTIAEYSVRAALRSPRFGRSRGRRMIHLRAKKLE